MFLKAAFKNASLFVQIVMLLAVISACTLFSILPVSLLIVVKEGASPDVLKDIMENLSDYPELMRGMQFLQTLVIFLFPAIICAWLFSDNYKEYLHADQPVHIPVAVWAVLGMIVVTPFINWTHFFNQQMTLPESFKSLETWIREAENADDKAIEVMLETKNISTIVFNFLSICVITAICEEFMFRGLLQTILGKVIRNPHVLIWIIAILFSAVHLQFYGFLPRMILGAWLGYLVYYTKTIWIPVLAHFTNNFYSVALYYLFHNMPDEMQKIDTIGTGTTWWLAVASLALFLFCFTQLKKAVNR